MGHLLAEFQALEGGAQAQERDTGGYDVCCGWTSNSEQLNSILFQAPEITGTLGGDE